jgi:hypothetical protein
LTTAPRIKPTSIFLRSARRPNPGRGSTYRRGIIVRTTGTGSRQRIFRKIGVVGAVILLPAWFYWGYLENIYVTWPTQPQPEIGRTVPNVVKEVEVYNTPDD